MTLRLFLDTAIVAYAVGGEHPHRAACRTIIEAAARGQVELHASVELVQEFCFHRLRRGSRQDAVTQARDVTALCVLHPVDQAIVEGMLDLIERTNLGGRDAVHAATAIRQGFSSIVTPDPDFDAIPGLLRMGPTEAAAECP
ncbi:MAG: type II toxin-antitoxin system VapC family toxin [Micropruina sp.]|nr:type II toxin-antitoxin system VapC family toxin [Micropruina sp.]